MKAVYSENHTKPNTIHIKVFENEGSLRILFTPYLEENTALHHYKDQLVNAVYGNNFLFWESHETRIHSVGKMQS
jgi:hypothetical protein